MMTQRGARCHFFAAVRLLPDAEERCLPCDLKQGSFPVRSEPAPRCHAGALIRIYVEVCLYQEE